jgi:hypothetical protein
VRILVLAAVAGSALLVAAQAPAGPEAQGKWRTVQVPSHKLSVSLPRSWQVRDEQGFALVALDPNSDPVVATAVSITTSPARGYTFGRFASSIRNKCGSDAQQFDPTAKITSKTKRFAFGRALVCDARIDASGQVVATRLYGFLHGKQGFAVSFQTIGWGTAKAFPTFDRIVGSIRFR